MLEFIFNTFQNSLFASSTALLALVISLYVLYTQVKPKKRGKRISSKPAFSFNLDIEGQHKDVITLIIIAAVLGAVFLLYAAFTKFEAKEYIGIGVLYIQHSFAQAFKDDMPVAAVLLSQEEQNIVVEIEEGDSEADTPITVAEEESAKAVSLKVSQQAAIKTKTEKPAPAIVAPPSPTETSPVATPPPPPIVTTVVEQKIENPEAEGDAPDATLGTLSYYGGSLAEGSVLSFSLAVKNTGKETMKVPFFTQLFVDNDNDGKINMQLSRLETRPLEVNEQDTRIWKGAWTVRVGTHRMEVCTDVTNVILEMNEKNNCTDLVFTIKGKEVTGDLIIEKVTVSPLAPHEGERVSFSARVKNIGTKLSPSSQTYFKLDGGFLGRIKIPSVGSSLYEDVGTAWLATAGSHSYEICADGKNEIFESSEDNNCVKGTLSTQTAPE